MPTAAPRLAHLGDITDLEHFHKLEIQHFFAVYKDLEPGKNVDVERGIDSYRQALHHLHSVGRSGQLVRGPEPADLPDAGLAAANGRQ